MCQPYQGYDLKEGIAKMPPRMREKIDSIPVDFRDRFDQNLLQSIMDVAGKSVAPSGRLFSSRKIWNNCISDAIPQVFTKNELSITTEDDSERNTLQFYLKDKSQCRLLELQEQQRLQEYNIDKQVGRLKPMLDHYNPNYLLGNMFQEEGVT